MLNMARRQWKPTNMQMSESRIVYVFLLTGTLYFVFYVRIVNPLIKNSASCMCHLL